MSCEQVTQGVHNRILYIAPFSIFDYLAIMAFTYLEGTKLGNTKLTLTKFKLISEKLKKLNLMQTNLNICKSMFIKNKISVEK